jgi:hypothetical protein
MAMDLSDPISKSESALATPVFLAHAIDDEVVPINNGDRLRQITDRLAWLSLGKFTTLEVTRPMSLRV